MNAGNDYCINAACEDSIYFFNLKNSQNETKLHKSTLLYEIGADFTCSAKCPVRLSLKNYIV